MHGFVAGQAKAELLQRPDWFGCLRRRETSQSLRSRHWPSRTAVILTLKVASLSQEWAAGAAAGGGNVEALA